MCCQPTRLARTWTGFALFVSFTLSAAEVPMLAPYTGLRVSSEEPPRIEVEIDGAWFELLALDGIPASELTAFSRRTYADKWQKRLGEDLVEVLVTLGHEPAATVSLELRAADGTIERREAVEMTSANREAVLQGNRQRRRSTRPPRTATMPGEQALMDLAFLQRSLADLHSYTQRPGVDLERLFTPARRALARETVPRVELVAAVRRVLEELGDGHTRVIDEPRPDRRRPPARTAHPRVERIGGVGYLRIPAMARDPEFLDDLERRIEALRDTAGLIIDVRGNGGGSRHALRLLLPYFLAPGSAPRVVNVAKYRVPPGEKPSREGDLDARFLYPETWSGFSAEERLAVERFRATFRPEWDPPAPEFGPWHYMLIGPTGPTGPTGPFYYSRRVVVLLDERCFSATDIFLGAFAELEQVTLVGKTSMGGSGFSRRLELPNSRIQVQMSRMASFRPNGLLYERRGIEPDLEVAPRPKDPVGDSDAQLDAALALLAREESPR